MGRIEKFLYEQKFIFSYLAVFEWSGLRTATKIEFGQLQTWICHDVQENFGYGTGNFEDYGSKNGYGRVEEYFWRVWWDYSVNSVTDPWKFDW